jgi:hypothetical protein
MRKGAVRTIPADGDTKLWATNTECSEETQQGTQKRHEADGKTGYSQARGLQGSLHPSNAGSVKRGLALFPLGRQ